MNKFVVLFRAINVGGKNLLPMKPLISLLEQEGFQEVAYYIQSGNIVLTSATDPTKKIISIVLKHFAFTPNLFVITEEALRMAQLNNPYKKVEGKFVHFYFTVNTIEINQEKLIQYLTDSESFEVHNNVFYLHAPDGIGRSKLVANIETCLGQTATGRNLNTVNKISLMLN